MIGETISHYRVLSRLGAGGMGVVYEAEDTRLGRKVAIKFLPEEANADAEAVQRFLREARVISSLNHPHICTLYDIGDHPSTPARSSEAQPGGRSGQARQFMVMELLDGLSLKDRVAKGAMPLEEVVELGAQMADALDAAHTQGIVHRDIKPANLFITRRGTLKVLDFGVAKLSKAVRGREHLDSTIDSTSCATDQLTTIGTTIGTVSYMSPEQARGQEIDARSDVFSAGIVLYEMATGQRPFPGATVATIFEGLLTKNAPAPSQVQAGLSPEFDRIIDKALEKDRETRYQSAAELRADLKRLKRATESGSATTASGTANVASGFSRTVAAPADVASGLLTAAASTQVVSRTLPAQAIGPVPGWRRGMMVGAPLLMVALVGGLLLYRSITTPALTAKDTVVLSSVVNRTGDTMFDDTLGEALALQLRQSPFLNVVPDQQVQSTLRLMGREPMAAITAEVGREVCQRSGAKALLGGTIAMLGSAYVVTLNAQDCVNGHMLAEGQVQASSKETVLAALGTAVSVFREQLGESLGSIQRYDAKIEEATTPSLEALKAYSQGLKTRRTTGDFDSVPFFRRAVELDQKFALAYARLGTVYSNLGQTDEAQKMTAKAYELRAKVSESERFYIEARYYTAVEPEPRKALDVYRMWLAAYPNEYTALANSSLLLKQLGENDEALRNQEAATRVAPDQPIAWNNLGDTYSSLARYDQAKAAFQTSLKLQNSSGARTSLYVMGILTGDQALADAQVEAMRGHRDEVNLVGVRMQAAAYRGRMQEAASLATEWQTRMDALSRGQQTGEGLVALAISEALVGQAEQARARIASAADDGLLNAASLDEQLVVAAIASDAAGALRLLPDAVAELKKTAGSGRQAIENERALRALAMLAERKPAEAITLLEPLTFDDAHSESIAVWGIAHVLLKNWPAAEKAFVFSTSKESRQARGSSSAYSHVMLARAQAELGKKDEARKTYQKFFDLWKDADPDVPLLLQAREEFVRLR